MQRNSATAEQVKQFRKSDFLVAVVPGALYRESPHTGTDGKRFVDVVKLLGMETARIPVKSFAPAEENARVILGWLSEHWKGGFGRADMPSRAALRKSIWANCPLHCPRISHVAAVTSMP